MLGRVSRSTAAGAVGLKRALASLALLLGVLALGGGAAGAVSQPTVDGTLTVFVSGPPPAKVFVTPTPDPPNPPPDDWRHPCEQLPEPSQDIPCTYSLPQGTVTLRAVLDPPDPSRQFLRWSDPECGANPVCETTLAETETIVATFSPVKLVLMVDGPGTLTATPVGGVGVTCGPPSPKDPNPFCPIEYPTITDVELEARPTNEGDPVEWSHAVFCEPDPDPTIHRCRAEVTYDPSYVGVGFGPDPNPPGNFLIFVTLRLLRGGEGSGRVTGTMTAAPGDEIINCGVDCSEYVQYARRVALTAHPDADSTFERWVGVCSTNPRCEFHAGAVTRLRAIFGRRAAPPPPAAQPQPPSPLALSGRILRVSVVRTRAGRRVVVARMRVNAAAVGRAQVKRGQRALKRRAVRVRAGANTLRLPLRASVRRGPAWFVVTLRNATTPTKSFRKRFVVPRRR